MRLEELAYRPEEELSDAELQLRRLNIDEFHHKNVELVNDEHASAKKRRAACQLDSMEISYFHRLRWIARAEADKRRDARKLSSKQARLQALREVNLGQEYSLMNERSLVEDIQILQKSIKDQIDTMKAERSFIEEHKDEISARLTLTGLTPDDDLRPPGMIEKAASAKMSVSDGALLSDGGMTEDDPLRPPSTLLTSGYVAKAPVCPPTSNEKAKAEKKRFHLAVGELWREIHPEREAGRSTSDEQLVYLFRRLHEAGFIPKRHLLPLSLWTPILYSRQSGKQRFDTFLEIGEFFVTHKKSAKDSNTARCTPEKRKYLKWMHSKGHRRKS